MTSEETTPLMREIVAEATAHDDVYLLPRRYRVPRATDEKTALDAQYDAADALVSGAYAAWLPADSPSAPGIRLIWRPLPAPTPQPQQGVE